MKLARTVRLAGVSRSGTAGGYDGFLLGITLTLHCSIPQDPDPLACSVTVAIAACLGISGGGPSAVPVTSTRRPSLVREILPVRGVSHSIVMISMNLTNLSERQAL